MSRRAKRTSHQPLDPSLDPLSPTSPKSTDLTIPAMGDKVLSTAQAEFNKRMKALEKARAAHERERTRLDTRLHLCRTEFMPMVEILNLAHRDLIMAAAEAHATMKLTARRRRWFGDLISGKCSDLLADPAGLAEGDIAKLEALIETFGRSFHEKEREQEDREDFVFFRDLMEKMARDAGVELDLGGVDVTADPADFERQMHERFAAAVEGFRNNPDAENQQAKKNRKPTKAALERERKEREIEEAKNRDIKTLYKQLAKVLHPDLETDPSLKSHKEAWMKRLTTARANGDLRDMLAIELEWLGEEAGNLAKASDEKLRIYSIVLKEQLDAIKEKTQMIGAEPQYRMLFRFNGPFGVIEPPSAVKARLRDETVRITGMTASLHTGGKPAQTMVHQWADDHAEACRR